MKFIKQGLIFFAGAFKETGDVSMARLQSFLLMMTGIILCFHGAYLCSQGKPVGEEIAIIGMLFANSFSTKYMGKREEVKQDSLNIQNTDDAKDR